MVAAADTGAAVVAAQVDMAAMVAEPTVGIGAAVVGVQGAEIVEAEAVVVVAPRRLGWRIVSEVLTGRLRFLACRILPERCLYSWESWFPAT